MSSLVRDAVARGWEALSVYQSKLLLSEYGIPVTRMRLVRTEDELLEAAREIGFPLVLKISSPQILHKTDVGGVVLNITDRARLVEEYRAMLSRVAKLAPRAEIEGVVVEEMVRGAHEVIIGGLNDRQFGPVVMFGLGWVFVEVLKDVMFELAPVDMEGAIRMVEGIRGARILKGYRGGRRADLEALARTIARASELLWDLRDYVSQMDLNPVFVLEKGVKVADARFLLKKG